MNSWLAVYQALYPAVGVAVAARMLAGGRSSTLREGPSDLKQRLGSVSGSSIAPESLWLHCASVGELAGAAALLRELPGRTAFVTCSTVAGRERAAKLPGSQAALLAPLDLLPVARRFLSTLKPRALIVLETELWPATLSACADSGVPFCVANARITERSFPRYRLARPLFAPILAKAAAVAAQTEGDAARFAALGVPEAAIRVTGNVKYDAAGAAPAAVEEARRLLAGLGWKLGSDLVWCAGCTRPGAEEAAILDSYRKLRDRFPGLRLILAPRHIERAGEAAEEISKRGLRYAKYSAPQEADCLLVDRLGALPALYAAADVAFVGGTLVPVGGHNLLEPAVAGVPVLFGPDTSSIASPAAALDRSGGGFRVADAEHLQRVLEMLLSEPESRASAGRRARKTASDFAGAARRTAQFLVERLAL
ncbi:MAG: 3-deoxy-D-manno-octulosonic acid transferase [Elusimicrobia bacterium]|nr:3-deoxy-D-manno-octulosonic acid transferase [Elusimicrobiota bacterium]